MKVRFTIDDIKGKCSNGLLKGDYFTIKNYKLSIPNDNKVCIWAMMHLLQVAPLLIEKESLPKDHWIQKYTKRKCPDGKVTFSIDYID